MSSNFKRRNNTSKFTKEDQTNKFICFDDLKEELQNAGYPISHIKDIQRLLKSKKSGKEIFDPSWETVISTKDAKNIFYTIVGKELNLSKIKYFPSYFRDIPLNRVSNEEYFDDKLIDDLEDSDLLGLIKNVQDWYLRILEEEFIEDSIKSPLLGIACSGGFLRGESKLEDSPLIISMQSGINIFVGDRGSGKSTVLDMLSLLLDSSRKSGQEDDITEWINPNRRIFDSYGNGRITRILKDYGVTKYVCYFYCNGYLYAFYANTQTKKWCLLYLHNGSWLISHNSPIEVFPELLILRQGDIFRITESRNRLIYNQLFEGLNHSLRDDRYSLLTAFDSLVRQYKLIEKNTQDNQNIANNSQYDLDLKNEVNKKEVEKGWVLFRLDNQLIDDFLRDQRRDLERIKIAYKGSNNPKIIWNSIESYFEKYEQIKWLLPEKSCLKLFKSGEAGLWCLYIGIIAGFLKEEINQLKNSKYNAKESEPSLSQDFSKIFFILEERLSILSEIQTSLEYLYEWNNDLKGFCNQAASFFYSQSELIRNQKNYSQKIERCLSFLEEQKIRFCTTSIDNQSLGDSLKQNEERYQLLLSSNLQDLNVVSPNQDLRSCIEFIQSYNSSISDLRNIFNKFNTIDDYELKLLRSDFIDFPIDVELKQGNTYRSFDKLSYGQKSGIILTIVLTMTNVDIVLIDQPEDNLDSYATAKILTPTLLKVCKQKVLGLATHNSGLVMGLGVAKPNLIVMESPSDYGGKRHSGKLNDPEIVNYMFEILEGGLPAWEEKLRFFKSFTEDLVLIEDANLSSTIASLRNIIQPRMNHNERLKSLRHDLSSKFPTLEEKQASVEELNSIIDALEKHDQEIIATINNIKNLTMGSYPENIELYSLIRNMMDNRPKISNIEYKLDPNLKDIKIYANPEDIQIVFRNLFDNSVKAIREAREERQKVGINNYLGVIMINLIKEHSDSLIIELEDNGIGIHPDIIDILYKERCSIRSGKLIEDHGHGGITIKSYLRANGGKITTCREKNRYRGINSGTVQVLTFKKRGINL
ncbi:ATP-binding protein [Pseudanabaena sp. Chao 1811]|uniref:ATP-binding protein n=1 Tax=Pseudanabaena sp. Chao 1811 TaxID=2963092 RepID=UPI0022F3F73B|nr:ATP-binding protein [Pseudanabaena sp. Chao 1811]